MMKLKTTSPICVRIVIAFLEFLSFVEGTTEIEIEYMKDLEHALKEIFRISDFDMESKKPKTSLLDLFITRSRRSKPKAHETSTDATFASSSSGLPNVELFHDFYMRVDACRFFEPIFGENYMARLARAKNLFNTAYEFLVEEVGTETLDLPALAEAFQILGVKSFNSTSFYKSIEYFTCAIALFKDNPDSFCTRAWALMMVERYQEAMNDCYRAIKLKPKCIRSYMGIGRIYFEQGKSIDAICHGFIKVLQIDPYNADALYGIEIAEKKLKQQLRWMIDQMGYHHNYDFIPINSYKHNEEEHQDIVLTFRPHDGGDDIADDGDNMSVNGGNGGDDYHDNGGGHRDDVDDNGSGHRDDDDDDGGGHHDDDGDNNNAWEATWKLEVGDVVDAHDTNSETVADFVYLFGRYTSPLE